MTTGELIRLLSHWCPDTSVSIITPDGELDIGHLVSAEDTMEDLDAEVVLTVLEG